MTHTEADEAADAWAHNTRLPYDMGRYGSTEIPDRREVEREEREMR